MEEVLICLRHVFQRHSGQFKFLRNFTGEFLVLGCLGLCSLGINAQILFRSSQARGQLLHLLLGDGRFMSLCIRLALQVRFRFLMSYLEIPDRVILPQRRDSYVWNPRGRSIEFW